MDTSVEVYEGSPEHLEHLRREIARLTGLVLSLGGDPNAEPEGEEGEDQWISPSCKMTPWVHLQPFIDRMTVAFIDEKLTPHDGLIVLTELMAVMIANADAKIQEDVLQQMVNVICLRLNASVH